MTSVSVDEPAMRLPPVLVDGEAYQYEDRSRYLVHTGSAGMETSFAGLTLEQNMGYIRKATVDAPTEIEMCNVRARAIAARTLRAWKAHRDANHNKATCHDVQGSAPGQERPRTRTFQTQGRRQIMEALWGLAAWWHKQQLTKQSFWTAGIIDEVNRGRSGSERTYCFTYGLNNWMMT